MASAVERAVRAALQGPEKKGIEVFDHDWNVKPAEIVRAGKRITAVGQISHRLRFRRDDQVYYTIVKVGDEVIDIDVKISRGGAAPFLAPLVAGVATLVIGVPIPPDKATDIGRLLGEQLDGDWKTAADALVGYIGMRL